MDALTLEDLVDHESLSIVPFTSQLNGGLLSSYNSVRNTYYGSKYYKEFALRQKKAAETKMLEKEEKATQESLYRRNLLTKGDWVRIKNPRNCAPYMLIEEISKSNSPSRDLVKGFVGDPFADILSRSLHSMYLNEVTHWVDMETRTVEKIVVPKDFNPSSK